MQRSQRKRCAPFWLKEKPYVKVRFTEDGVIMKVTESWRIKLTQDSKELHGCLTKFTFLVGEIHLFASLQSVAAVYFERQHHFLASGL